MQAWLESLAPGYGSALMWTIFALVGLLILLVLVRIVRGLTFGTFVAGGRNRKARLAVMDATAVDNHRRLVLVRRDDVEHLILIGGPTDLVVEQNIRLLPPSRRPAAEDAASTADHPQTAPSEPGPPRLPPQQAARAAQPTAPPYRPPAQQPVAAPSRPVTVAPVMTPLQPEPRKPTPPAQPAAARSAAPPQATSVQTLRPVAAPSQQPAPRHDLDDSLLEELQVTLENEKKPAAPAQPAMTAAERSLDDEMSRLLSDLSGPKR